MPEYEITIQYPKDVSAVQFMEYLKNRHIDTSKLNKYFEQIDKYGEALVISSADDALLQKATTTFRKLGFTVQKTLHLEIAPEKSEVEKEAIYTCPVCDTERKRDEPGHEQPCPVCKFVHTPEVSGFTIAKRRIEWAELQRSKNQEKIPPELVEYKKQLEMELRQEIRAELSKKFKQESKNRQKWFDPKVMIPVAVVLAVACFFAGYYLRAHGFLTHILG